MLHKSKTGKRIIKNAAYLAVGSIFGKAAIFIVFIIVARIFGPENYGIYNTAFTHVYLMGILSKMGFDMTMIREGAKNTESAWIIQNKFFALRFWLSIVVWALTLLTLFIMDYHRDVQKMILIMSPIILSGGAISSGMLDHYTCYYMIVEKMQYASYVVLFRTMAFSIVVSILIYLKQLTMIRLAIVIVLTSFMTLCFQMLQAKKHYTQKYDFKIDVDFIKPLIRPIVLFGIVSIFYEVSLRINILLLNKLSTNVGAGLFSAAFNLISIGTLFIVSFSSSVFPNSARNIFRKDFRQKLFIGLVWATMLFSLGCILMCFASRAIVVLFYGNKYLEAAAVLTIVVWLLPLRLLSLWGHQVLESADYLFTRIIVFVLPTLLNIALNFLLIPRHGVLGSAYAALISNIALFLISSLTASFVIRKDHRFAQI